MAGGRDVIDQADALMRRHRSYVVQPDDAVPPAPTFDADDADVPLLTDIVAPEQTAPIAPDATLAALRQDIEAALAEWLAEALPAAFAQASRQLLAELDAQARRTLLPLLLERLAAPHDAVRKTAE